MFAVIECLFTRVWARAKEYVEQGFLSQEISTENVFFTCYGYSHRHTLIPYTNFASESGTFILPFNTVQLNKKIKTLENEITDVLVAFPVRWSIYCIIGLV